MRRDVPVTVTLEERAGGVGWRRDGYTSVVDACTVSVSRPERSRLARAGIGERTGLHDLGPTDDDVGDAVRLAVHAAGAAGEVVAQRDRLGTHEGRVEDDDVGHPAFADLSPVTQTVQARRPVGEEVHGLLQRQAARGRARHVRAGSWCS